MDQAIKDDNMKTIHNLKKKIIKLEESRKFLKSNYLEEEKKMDLDTLSKQDLKTIKKLLLKQIIEQNDLNDMLAQRCDRAREVINIFEANVQFDSTSILKL